MPASQQAKNKVAGRKWEVDSRDALRAELPEFAKHIERNGSIYGTRDRGDIRGVPNFTIECKNEKTLRLGEYQDELAVEMANNSTRFGAVLVKRRNKSAAEAYAIMPLAQLTEIIALLHAAYGELPHEAAAPAEPVGGAEWVA